MAKKLKTFLTDSGFFQLAVAAPSMQAALRAWGMTHNVFADGLAKETKDAKIVEAAMAQPGTVLRRALHTKGAFSTDAQLPKVKPSKLPRNRKPRADASAVRKLEAALDAGRKTHQKTLQAIEDEIADAKARAHDEASAWRDEEKRLKAAVKAART